MGPKCKMIIILIRKGRTLRYTEGRRPWENRGRNWSEIAIR